MNYNKAELCKDCKMPEKPVEKMKRGMEALTPKYRDRQMIKALKIIFIPKIRVVHENVVDTERIKEAFVDGGDLDQVNAELNRHLRNASAAAKKLEKLVDRLRL